MTRAKTSSAPYTIEQAVEDELEFWRRIGGIIGDKVSAEAQPMRTVVAAQEAVVEAVSHLTRKVSVIDASVARLEGLALKKSLADDQLRDRIERLLNVLERSARPTPPSAPGNGGGAGHD